MRFCLSATAVTDERVADRPADDQREEASVKPLLYAVATLASASPVATDGNGAKS